MAAISIIAHARTLASEYPVWLCDIWGVLHNGVAAFPAAAAALVAFRKAGGTVVLITNAPRPHDDVRRQISDLGVPNDAHDAIVTSGDVTRTLIAEFAGRRVFHLGAERDRTIYDGLAVSLASEDGAEAVVCTGLVDDLTQTPGDYRRQLEALRQRQLPMICANPDIMVERGSSLCYCAGALGQAYEALGGKVAYAGKPHQPIYDAALAQAGTLRQTPVAKSAALAIGDGLLTDIEGARRFGIAALFVASGIHLGADEVLNARSLARLFADVERQPIAAIERLAW